MARSRDAIEANRRACEHIDARRFVDAIPDAKEAARLAPDWPGPWLNLVVAYKHAAKWADCLAAVDHAIAIATEVDVGLHWNEAIAATALGDWSRARAAWKAAGVPLPPGDGPIDMNIGPTPVRVAVDTAPEVVWCHRIDPCRARIISIPLPDTQRRHGDLLLHDGEPRGRRRLGDESVSVFDELAVLERSHHGTWQASVDAPNQQAVVALVALFENTEVAVEDWTASLEMLCQQCSLGEPHVHEDKPAAPWVRERRIAFAALDEGQLEPLHQRAEVLELRRLL